MGRDAQLSPPPHGSILLTHSQSLVGLIIRFFTLAWFRWNHAAAVVWIDGEPWVFEVTTQVSRPDDLTGAVRPGIRAERWASWITAQTDHVWWTRPKYPAWPFDSFGSRRWYWFWIALHEEGVKYDYVGAIMSAAPGDVGPNDKATFCSAAVMRAIHELDIGFKETARWWEWTPADIARSSLFTKPRRIK